MLNLKSKIREIPNWPTKGINFKDLSPILNNSRYFRYVINNIAKPFIKNKPDVVIGIDARGFIFAAAVAYKLNLGLVMIRKKGKLPWKKIQRRYKLEYGDSAIEIHKDAIKPGEKVLIIDDVLATGGTMKAAVDLVEKLKGRIIGIGFVAELAFLKGRKMLRNYNVYSLVKYDK